METLSNGWIEGICFPDDGETEDDPMLCSPDDPDRFLSKYDLDDWSKPESYYGWTDDFEFETLTNYELTKLDEY